MAYRVFLDANIILDFILKRDSFDEAQEIIHLAADGKISAYVTPSIIQISGYWISKLYGSKKSKELLMTLLSDIKIIDIPHLNVISALNSQIDDIEDAIQYYSAIHHKMDYFISLDKKLIKYALPVLPVISPENFLKEF